MAKVILKGNEFHTCGEIPATGSVAPNFKLVKNDLSEVSLENYAGKRKVLNIFQSIDTGTCAASVRQFNKAAADLNQVAVLNISADLPFAQSRFCGAEGIKNSESLSAFRSTFGKDYGIQYVDGPLLGLCARAVLVLDEHNKVIHAELVSEVANEPNYEAALKALKS